MMSARRREASGIDDPAAESIGHNGILRFADICAEHSLHMSRLWAVASLAADGQFGKGCAFELSVAFRTASSAWAAAA
jgi:hypothetical protein